MQTDVKKIDQLEVNPSEPLIDELNNWAWNERGVDVKIAYQTAVKTEQASIDIAYKKGAMDSLKIQGYCLWRFSDFPSSMASSTEALRIAETLDNLKAQGDILNNIGAVYMFLKDHQKRLETNLKCLEIRKQIDDYSGISGSLNNIGETYMEMGKLTQAKQYFNECLAYEHSTEDSKAWVYHNLGILSKNGKEYFEGIQHLKASIELTKNLDYKILDCGSYYHIASCYFRMSKFEACHSNLNLAFELANKLGAKEEQQNIHLAYSELFEVSGDITQAFQHYKKYSELKSEIYNEQNDARMINLKGQHEIDVAKREAKIERTKNEELKLAFNEIDKQKKLVEQKNFSIQSSISYAERIQKAILENEKELDETGLEFFVIYQPKDVVSGDFFWHKIRGNYVYFAVVDCTGHGVPGAFLSMLGVAFLNEICSANTPPETGNVLNQLRDKVINLLSRKDDQYGMDGMDMTMMRLNRISMELQYSGAMNKSYIVRDGEVLILKPDSMSVSLMDDMQPFSSNDIKLMAGDMLYQLSDGVKDQFGGPRDKKLGAKRVQEWLSDLSSTSCASQQLEIEKRLLEWSQGADQTDDITLFGLRV